MYHKTALTAAAMAVLVSSPISAQGFVGAELGIDVFAFSDNTNLGYTTYSGSLEYGITRNFDVAIDLSRYGLNSLDENVNNATLHAIYHPSNTMSVGAFFGRDYFNRGSIDSLGIEGGAEVFGGDLEGFLGRIDDGTDTGTIYGISGAYPLGGNFAATGEVKAADIGGNTLTRAALGAQYGFDRGPNLYGQIGTIDVGATNETFFSLGATVALGSQRGTTFGSRSLLDIVPGY